MTTISSSIMTYALIYLEINLASIALLAIIAHKTRGLTQMVAQRNFVMALRAQTVFFLSDTFCVLVSCGVLRCGAAALLMGKEVYFFSTALMCFFWFVYFEHLQETPFAQRRRLVWLSSALVWVMGVLLLVNLFTGFLFYVDGEGVYHRGPLFPLQYALSYVYVLFTCVRALIGSFRERRLGRRRMLRSLAAFPIAPAGAGILQFVFPQLPLACAALSLATLGLYLGWLEEMISIDPLTQLNNRKRLIYHYEMWIQNPAVNASLYLLMIDANRFKGINDTYGHTQGDAALVRIADALRLGCRGHSGRVSIARYGGDEFVILASAAREEEIEELQGRINARLAELNRAANAPYELTVSIGAVRAKTGESLKELIERADVLLYQEKERAHQMG